MQENTFLKTESLILFLNLYGNTGSGNLKDSPEAGKASFTPETTSQTVSGLEVPFNEAVITIGQG